MTHPIKDQIKAVQTARKIFHIDGPDYPIREQLNDAAQTLQAILLIFGGGEEKIRAEFKAFSLDPSREPFTGADDFIDFLKSKGLNLDLIK